MDYHDKIAVVTGANSGIGEATAVRLAGMGATVAVVGHRAGSADHVVDQIVRADGTALSLAADVGDPDAVEQLFSEIGERLGRVDLVVANAGINGVWAPLEELGWQDWQQTITVNLGGTFLTVKHALPLLKAAGGGSVVITASVNGTRMFSNSGASAYAASKAAQVAFAKSTAVELARHSIRVNVVCPGSVETEIDDNTEQRDTDGLHVPVEYPEGQIPLTGTQSARAEQVADLICFLGSDAASHITGTEVWIDGGQSLLAG
ncbi:SDR family oxidoreductase [Micropruina sp.]|uniref:SDR family oxidoreductase n=1 Tax=Micropruina sp. TaxID=2737536 RepID=UPI0039E60DE1